MPSVQSVVRVAACATVCVVAGAAGAAERLVWFGTYTGGPAKSEGIYVSRFDDATGSLSPVKLAGAASNPSYLALHPRLPVLYSVAEVGKVDGKPGGAVAAFAFDPATGMLAFKGRQSSGGSGPCHLTVDASGKAVLAANYGGGSTICLGLTADGAIEPVVSAADGQSVGFVQHVFELREIQTLSTLPADVTERKGYSGAEIVAHPSGKFLYASNRGHDTIAMYAVDEASGKLTFLGVEPIQGAVPRNFAVDPSGKFLLTGGQNSNTVSVFTIDQATGRLAFTGTKIDVPSPVSIVFGRP